jgi:hypothetical protein
MKCETGATNSIAFEPPAGLAFETLKEAVDLIVDWEENEVASDPVRLALAIFHTYAKGQGDK